MADGTITIGAKIETKQFDRQIEYLEKEIATMEKAYSTGLQVFKPEDAEDMEKLAKDIEKAKNQLAGLYQQKAKIDGSSNGQGFGGFSNGLRDAVKHAARLALSVFGIRTAYMALRRASSELATYDTQYATNLEYIRFALTQLVAPALVWIVNLAKTVLMYINYIVNALFGVNLFSKASAENFKQMKRGIGGANSEAKKLQKTLTGFDEMNILNSSSTGGGGGIGGSIGPDFDLSDIGNWKPPEWIAKVVDYIKKNKDVIIQALKEIAGIIGVIASLKVLGVLKGIATGFGLLATEATLLTKVLAGAGLALIFIGIGMAIKGVIDFIDNPSWENGRKIILGLTTAVAGLGAVMVALNATNPIGWILLVTGALVTIIQLVKQLTGATETNINTINAEKSATDALRSARDHLRESTNKYVSAIDRAEEAEKNLTEAEKQAGMTASELLKKMANQNLTYKDLTQTERVLYKAILENDTAQEQLDETTQRLTSATKSYSEQGLILIAVTKEKSKNVDEYRDKLVQLYNEGRISAEETADALAIALADMDWDTRRIFVENIPNEIKDSLNPSQYQAKATQFKNWWNGDVMGTLKKQIDIKLGASWASTALKSMLGFKSGGIVKLASGGVVNMPNRGVPLASAIAGESGREGIVPLTDSGAMQELGKEIGKWITINANITNNMNGRVISRELRSIQNDQSFAYNS